MKRICPIHGIYTKQSKNDGCQQCKRATARVYDDNYRNKEYDKFYHSREWKRVRGLQLKRKPLCVECGRPAKVVDHIVEIRDGGCKLCLDNLQSMCIPCHNAKTAAEKIHRRGAKKSLQDEELNTDAPYRNTEKQFSGGTLG